MRNSFSLLFTLLPFFIFAQFGPQQIVSDSSGSFNYVQAGDLDGDGDIDLVSSSATNNTIAWHENIDGLGTFAPQVVISDSAEFTQTVFTADLDGDGDLDVLGPGFRGGGQFWYENTDGKGTFNESRPINSNGLTFSAAYVSDIDGDLDNDIVATTGGGNILMWLENTDGKGSFTTVKILNDTIRSSFGVITADLDGDDDQDILCSSFRNNQVSWFENLDGKGNFGAMRIISDSTFGAVGVRSADLDGDGDLDVLSASMYDDKIAWYENSDGKGNFGVEHVLSTDALAARHAYPSDIDLDGDMDVLSISRDGGKILYFENLDGQGTFEEGVEITDRVRGGNCVITADIDGDGDPDMASASYSDNQIAWYENLYQNPIIKGWCFLDENENGLLDSNEVTLRNQEVSISPAAYHTWSNREGIFQILADTGAFTIAYVPDSLWKLTTDSIIMTDTLNYRDTVQFQFGLIGKNKNSQLDISLSSAPTRCNFEVPFWLNCRNTGTQITDSWIRLELDSSTSFITASPLPDSIQGDTLYWLAEQLQPTFQKQIELLLKMPGVNAIGDSLFFTSSALTPDNGNLQLISQSTYSSLIRCAYDPNDKLVFPNHPSEENFTLFGDTLEYTVRFQNTGNDTAFTVRIDDQLDQNLDWSTFEPLTASHPYEITLTDAGLLIYTFNNILLPDSTINEAASHGFFKYRILPLENLDKGTVIENTASIFFDFNPPIVTNTTINTLTDQIVSINEPFKQAKLIQHFSLYPNPANSRVQLDIQLARSSDFSLSVWDARGQQTQRTQQMRDQKIQWSLSDLTAGIYFVQLRAGNEIQTKKLIILQ